MRDDVLCDAATPITPVFPGLRRLAVAAALVLLPAAAYATPVSVTPTSVVLKPGSASELITLTNESDTAARFEVTAHAWTESEDGKTNLTPTTDIIVFPALLELPARGSKKIRLGAENLATNVEKNYRLAIHELPQAASGQALLQIQVLTNMTLPIFLAAPNAQPKAKIENAGVEGGKLTFTVSNGGSAHFMLQRIDIAGRSAAAETFAVSQKGWYVLAGGRRTFKVDLGGDACRQTTALNIKAITDGTPTETRVSLPAGTCGQGAPRFIDTRSAEPPAS